MSDACPTDSRISVREWNPMNDCLRRGLNSSISRSKSLASRREERFASLDHTHKSNRSSPCWIPMQIALTIDQRSFLVFGDGWTPCSVKNGWESSSRLSSVAQSGLYPDHSCEKRVSVLSDAWNDLLVSTSEVERAQRWVWSSSCYSLVNTSLTSLSGRRSISVGDEVLFIPFDDHRCRFDRATWLFPSETTVFPFQWSSGKYRSLSCGQCSNADLLSLCLDAIIDDFSPVSTIAFTHPRTAAQLLCLSVPLSRLLAHADHSCCICPWADVLHMLSAVNESCDVDTAWDSQTATPVLLRSGKFASPISEVFVADSCLTHRVVLECWNLPSGRN